MTIGTRQKGMVLVVSLIMLVVLTLLAVAALNMSTVNLHIVGNTQTRMDERSAVEMELKTFISNLNNFTTYPAPGVGTFPVQLASGDTYNVTVDPPVCLTSVPSPGWQSNYDGNGNTSGGRVDDEWAVTAHVGTQVVITQGVDVQSMTQNCPTISNNQDYACSFAGCP